MVKEIKIGTGRTICEGKDLAILSIGHIGNYVTHAINELRKDHINPGHFDMRFVKPIDKKLLHHILDNYKYILTVEDGCIIGGFGSAILEFMSDNNYKNYVNRLGIPDTVIEHGTQDQLYAECGYDSKAIINASKKIIEKELSSELTS